MHTHKALQEESGDEGVNNDTHENDLDDADDGEQQHHMNKRKGKSPPPTATATTTATNNNNDPLAPSTPNKKNKK